MSTPLILLHGALGSCECFEPLLPHLEGIEDIHLLNFEGHGLNEMSERPFRIEHFAENVLDYMNEHRIRQADLFGYSMGGIVALYIANLGPERVRRIFTLSTKFEWTPEIAEREIRFLEPNTILEKVPQYAERLQNRFGDTWREVLSKTADMMVHLGDTNTLDDASLNGIEHLVRVGIGDRDKMVSLGETRHVYEHLSNSEFQVLPGTPHPIEQMSMERLGYEIRDFYTA